MAQAISVEIHGINAARLMHGQKVGSKKEPCESTHQDEQQKYDEVEALADVGARHLVKLARVEPLDARLHPARHETGAGEVTRTTLWQGDETWVKRRHGSDLENEELVGDNHGE